jgi:catechol 2,3-dioxygenase
MNSSLPTQIHIGAVALIVRDMIKSSRFYEQVLGLRKLANTDEGELVLGAGGVPLFRLLERPDAESFPDRPGLYHTAILLPSRFALARVLYQLVERGYQLQGAADHGVSEALYLADPEGNGIELYRDRPQSEWPRDEQGELDMTTDPLNLDQLVFELKGKLEDWRGIDPQTRVGHVHLQVSSIPEAERFYTEVIGLDLQQRYGAQAAFLAAGGYHHHVGINTWQSQGAAPAPAGAAGLRYFELILPDEDAVAAIVARAHQAELPTQGLGQGWLIRDPSGNGVVVRGE